MAKQTHAGQAAIMKRVLHYIKRSWLVLFLSILFAAVTVVLTLYVPILTGNAIDHIVDKGLVDFDGLLRILIMIVICVLVTALAQWLMNVCNNRITYQVVRDIRSEAIRKIEVLTLGYNY